MLLTRVRPAHLLTVLLVGLVLLGLAPTPVPAAETQSTKHTTTAEAEGDGYRLFTDETGQPLRWNPCEPVRWAYNHRGGRRGALRATKMAFRRLERASGMTFEYAGRTRSRPFVGEHPDEVDIRVGWSSARRSSRLGPRTGGYAYVSYETTEEGTPEIVTGDLELNASVRTNRRRLRLLLLHEVGHLAGLDHVDARRQLMFGRIVMRRHLDYRRGDRRGLAVVGADQGCVEASTR